MHKLIATKGLYNFVIAVIAMMLLVAANYVNYVVQDRSKSHLEAVTQQHLSRYHNLLDTNLQNHIQIVRGLPGLFAVNPQLTQAQFETAMTHLFNGENQLRNIAAAPDMKIQYMYPVENNEAAMGLDYRSVPDQFASVERARQSGELVLAGPLTLKQGGTGLISRIPVFLHRDQQPYFWGIISAVIDSEKFFSASQLSANMPIEFAIRGKDGLGAQGEMVWGQASLFDDAKLTMRLDLPEGYWQMVAQPLGGWQVARQLAWQTGLLIFGIAFAIFALLTSFIRFMFMASRANLKFRHLIDNAPVPYLLINRNQHISYINQAFIESYGYRYQDLPNLKKWWGKTNIDPIYQHQFELWFEGRLQPKQLLTTPTEITIETQQAEQRVALLSTSLLKDTMGDELLLVIYDITLRKRAEQQLRFTSQVFDQAHEGIMITDMQGIILDINPAFSEITQYSREATIGQPASLLKSDKHDIHFFTDLWQVIREKHYWQGEIWNKRQDGSLFAALLTISALTDAEGVLNHYVGMFSDITQTKQQQETLEFMAHYDVLTKLPNRVLFAEQFEKAVAYSKRTKTWLGICFLDLDNFKPVNDLHGHTVGDQLLIQVAARLTASVRDKDSISRFGGDEFAIIFRDINSLEQCEFLLQRIHEDLSQPYHVSQMMLRISASSGIAMYPQDDADLGTLLRHADQAMYQAKLTGRNTYQIFNPDQNQQAIEKHQLLREITEAIEHNQLVLHFQPEVNMKTGQIMGVEALIRWQHPEKGLLMPMQFLPFVYGTQQEVAIGEWVIKNAIEQLTHFEKQGLSLFVSVNIAASHLQTAGFVENLQQSLMRFPQILPHRLQLEILETSALSDVMAVSQIIRDCRELVGVSVALDDFGTGYSSLTHLRHLQASTVKIDQSFVRNMLDDPDDFNIIDGVIGLARAFNRQVVAEGVETLAHGKALLLLGCELAQGYFIAKPMPAQALDDWLEQHPVNSEWQAFALRPRSAQQQALQLYVLISERWIKQLLAVTAVPDSVWPMMNIKQCHCGKWLLQAHQAHLFEPEFITLLNTQHQQLHHLAQQFKAEAAENDVDTATWQESFKQQLQVLQNAIADYDETL